MKIIFSMLFFVIVVFTCQLYPQSNGKDTALLIIDIQNFYFPGGKSHLENAEPASINARKLLERFRQKEMTIIHIRHNFEPGGEIHENVKPAEGEKLSPKML